MGSHLQLPMSQFTCCWVDCVGHKGMLRRQHRLQQDGHLQLPMVQSRLPQAEHGTLVPLGGPHCLDGCPQLAPAVRRHRHACISRCPMRQPDLFSTALEQTACSMRRPTLLLVPACAALVSETECSHSANARPALHTPVCICLRLGSRIVRTDTSQVHLCTRLVVCLTVSTLQAPLEGRPACLSTARRPHGARASGACRDALPAEMHPTPSLTAQQVPSAPITPVQHPESAWCSACSVLLALW